MELFSHFRSSFISAILANAPANQRPAAKACYEADVYSILNISLFFIISSLSSIFVSLICPAFRVSIFNNILSIQCVIISLICLYKGQKNTASSLLTLSCYIPYLVDGRILSLQSVTVLPVSVCTSFLSTNSTKRHLLNFLISLGFNTYLIVRYNPFTLDTSVLVEQVNSLRSASYYYITQIFFCFYLIKKREKNSFASLEEVTSKNERINTELMAALDSKISFLSCLSDEIRNPLNSLVGNLDYLLGSLKDLAHIKLIHNARMASNVLLYMVDSILDACKLQKDNIELRYSTVRTHDIIEQLFSMHKESLLQKNLKVICYLAKDVPSTICTDPSRLLQILMNLFSNAIKFSSEFRSIKIFISWHESYEELEHSIDEPLLLDPTPVVRHTCLERLEKRSSSMQTIRLQTLPHSSSFQNFHDINEIPTERLESFNEILSPSKYKHTMKEVNNINREVRDRYEIFETTMDSDRFIIKKFLKREIKIMEPNYKSGFFKISIQDYGCGISEEKLPHIFELFNNQNNLQRTHRGTGLGLWICKKVLTKLEGDIKVETKLGEGTRFSFFFPVVNPKMTAIKQYSSTENILRLEKKVKVLVVDDLQYNRELHKYLLEENGAIVELAENGLDALEKYKQNPVAHYDFILTDLQMPVMDGMECCKKIREFERENGRRHVDIYILSGNCFETQMEECVSPYGKILARDFLRKPLDIQKIKKIMNNYLEYTNSK